MREHPSYYCIIIVVVVLLATVTDYNLPSSYSIIVQMFRQCECEFTISLHNAGKGIDIASSGTPKCRYNGIHALIRITNTRLLTLIITTALFSSFRHTIPVLSEWLFSAAISRDPAELIRSKA